MILNPSFVKIFGLENKSHIKIFSILLPDKYFLYVSISFKTLFIIPPDKEPNNYIVIFGKTISIKSFFCYNFIIPY